MWLFHPLSGNGYQFWSGIGSDFSELTLLAGVYMIWKKHNCHTDQCLRIGKHTVNGSPYCSKHHMKARKRK